MKSDFDELIIDTVPVDLYKLSHVISYVVKKTMYDQLIARVNAIDTNGFLLKTHNDTDKSGIEKKINDADKNITDTSEPANKTDDNAKSTEIKSKILSISSLATTAALNIVEYKIPNVIDLVKKKKL